MNKWTKDRFLKFNIYSIFSKSIHPPHPMWSCSNSLREYIILFYEWGSRQWIKGLSNGVTKLESGISGPQPRAPSAFGVNHPSADKPTGMGSWEPGTDWHLTRDLMSVFWESGAGSSSEQCKTGDAAALDALWAVVSVARFYKQCVQGWLWGGGWQRASVLSRSDASLLSPPEHQPVYLWGVSAKMLRPGGLWYSPWLTSLLPSWCRCVHESWYLLMLGLPGSVLTAPHGALTAMPWRRHPCYSQSVD